jgi:hypothetical protein
VILASATPRSQKKASAGRNDGSMDLFGAQRLDEPMVSAPAFLPSTFTNSDPLGPLILRSGFSTSYAADDQLTDAQEAASKVAEAGRAVPVVQIGAFGDKANAERVAARFGSFGKPVVGQSGSSQKLYTVRVLVNRPAMEPGTVIEAANAAGIPDAFLVAP